MQVINIFYFKNLFFRNLFFKFLCTSMHFNILGKVNLYKKLCHTGPKFFCHREKFFFCRPPQAFSLTQQQVIFLCTLKHNGKANFKKFLNTGQRVDQRVGTYRDNHIYLKIHAGELNFKHTCARTQNHKNLLNLNIVKKIFCQNFKSWSDPYT